MGKFGLSPCLLQLGFPIRNLIIHSMRFERLLKYLKLWGRLGKVIFPKPYKRKIGLKIFVYTCLLVMTYDES